MDALQPRSMTFYFVHCYSRYGRSLMVSLQENLSARKKCFASNVSMSLSLVPLRRARSVPSFTDKLWIPDENDRVAKPTTAASICSKSHHWSRPISRTLITLYPILVSLACFYPLLSLQNSPLKVPKNCLPFIAGLYLPVHLPSREH